MRLRAGLTAGVLVVAVAGFAAAPAPLDLGTPVPLAVPAGEHPIGVAVADVTGDGKADVVMAANDFARVLVYAGDGAGTFGTPVPITLSATNCTRLRAARLDGDAVPDLVADHVGTTTVDVLLANRPGGFALATYAAADGAGGETEVLCLADWDLDGDTDIVTAGSTGKVRVRLNDGAGAFSASQTIAWANGTTPPAAAYDIVAADLDGDGDTDVALREATSTGVYWRQPDGTLAAGPRLLPPQSSGFSNHGIVAADLDGDGWIDVADLRTVTISGPAPRGAVNVFRHVTATTFAAAEPYDVATGQWDMTTADLNGDLRPEIVCPTDLLVNRGDGRFDVSSLPATGWGVATGNFDDDARPDVVVADVFNGGGAIPVRSSAADPFVATATPSTLHVGASRTVTFGGSGFVAGATVDFGGDVVVHGVSVPSDATLVADVTVSAAATPRNAVVTVTNPSGGASSTRMAIVAGGNAGFVSVAPDHMNAGDAATLTVTGTGFQAPVTASLGADVVVESATFVDAQTLHLGVMIPVTAAAGARDLRLVNGTGVPTVAPGAFTVVRAPSVDLVQTRGRLKTSAKPRRGSVDVRGTYAFNGYSPDDAFDPLTEDAAVAVGDPATPLEIAAPAGGPWKVRRGRATWKSPRRTFPRVTLTLDLAKHTFRLVAKRADLVPPATLDVLVRLTLGDETGTSVAAWTAPRRGGGLQLR